MKTETRYDIVYVNSESNTTFPYRKNLNRYEAEHVMNQCRRIFEHVRHGKQWFEIREAGIVNIG